MYYDTAYCENRKQYSVAGIVSRLRLDNQGITVPFPAWTKGFKVPKLTPGTTQPSIPWVPGALHRGGMKVHFYLVPRFNKECSKTSHPLNSS